MNINYVTNDIIALTSSKGNQEKWYDKASDKWFKLDQFGYEAFSEAVISALLEESNIEKETPFRFVRYSIEKINVHGHIRIGCSSRNFLKQGQSLITLRRLFSKKDNVSLKSRFERLSSNKKRLAYLAETTAEYTGLKLFPQYLTMLFEIDALFLNDDRHLNNIAVIEENGRYDYCPVFDNGAGLLSNTMIYCMDIEPSALIKEAYARPFNTTFNRQRNTVEGLYGKQLKMPVLNAEHIRELLNPMLEFYSERDRGFMAERTVSCILSRQKR